MSGFLALKAFELRGKYLVKRLKKNNTQTIFFFLTETFVTENKSERSILNLALIYPDVVTRYLLAGRLKNILDVRYSIQVGCNENSSEKNPSSAGMPRNIM